MTADQSHAVLRSKVAAAKAKVVELGRHWYNGPSGDAEYALARLGAGVRELEAVEAAFEASKVRT